MEPRRKKGKTIHSEAREIIRHVIRECDEEARAGEIKIDVAKRNLRVSNYTGVSERTVSRIRRECLKAGDSRLSSPGKHRPKPASRKAELDSFDGQVIRNTVRDFYLIEKKVPTCSKLLTAIKEKIDFPWCAETLRKILKQMGFEWKKCINKRKILMEGPHILDWRFKYLSSIRKAREEGKQIIYLYETWVDNTLTFKKCWQSDGICDIQTNSSSSNRLVIVHAGCESGFLENSLVIFKAGLVTGEYHGQMNAKNFEKWVTDRLLPSIPANSIIVMDNAPYRTVEHNKAPTKYALKSEMMSWLESNNIPFTSAMRKVQLFHLISQFKSREKVFHIDELFKETGHTVVRLPPYMCELNLIELAWAKVKRIVRGTNITTDFSLLKLEETTRNAIAEVNADDWKVFCNHMKKTEEEYWVKDAILETEIEKFMICVDVSESSSSESDSDLAELLS
jgi:transposase